MQKARLSFLWLAQRGSVCYQTMQYLHALLPNVYTFTYQQFLQIYSTAIIHSERCTSLTWRVEANASVILLPLACEHL